MTRQPWITVAGLALGLLVPTAARSADQQTAVQRVLKLGGQIVVGEDRPGQPIVGVDLRYTPTTDADLPVLQGLPSLEWLLLWDTLVTDAGLPALRGLQQLRMLSLFLTQVTDAGLPALQGLPSLD